METLIKVLNMNEEDNLRHHFGEFSVWIFLKAMKQSSLKTQLG